MVKIRNSKIKEWCIVESPNGEQYKITDDITFIDLRAQIMLYNESGWKVVDGTYGMGGNINPENGQIDYIHNYPFKSITVMCAESIRARTHKDIKQYLEKTSEFFNE